MYFFFFYHFFTLPAIHSKLLTDSFVAYFFAIFPFLYVQYTCTVTALIHSIGIFLSPMVTWHIAVTGIITLQPISLCLESPRVTSGWVSWFCILFQHSTCIYIPQFHCSQTGTEWGAELCDWMCRKKVNM